MLTTAFLFLCVAIMLLGAAVGKPLGWIAGLCAVASLGVLLLGMPHALR